jgi:hypothetical protein
LTESLRKLRLGAAVLALAGCYTGAGANASGGATDGATDGSEDGDPLGCGDEASISPLRRLSEQQYRNALRDLFAPAGVDVSIEAATELERIPMDEHDTTFAILDARVSDQHARAYYRLADRLAAVTAFDDTHLANVAGECALEAEATDACIDAFLDDFGARVYRRPLDDAERERYHAMRAEADNATELFRSMIFSMLLSPQFLYHVEVDGEGDDARFELDAYALASRLSFHFWQSMPDDELFAAAADGSILTSDGYAAQLDRVFEDPRTRVAVDKFYDEWLQVGWLTTFPDTPAFATFAEDTTLFDPDADHLVAAQQEIHDLARHYTFDVDGSLADLLLTDLSFTQSPHLAALYGVEPWDGESDPPRMPEGERAGLLTRMAFLVSGSHDTHPVHRGAVVRQRILCDTLQLPDPGDLPDGSLDPPPVTDNQTTRERYEAKTADALCAGCHASINPLGFILERYDAIGRVRSEERIIDELTGEVLATLPIDSTANPLLGQDDMPISSGPELSAAVVDSGKVEGCFAQQYFRATFGRSEVEEDMCAIEAVEDALRDEESLRQALRTIALAPVFRARRVR